MTFSELGMAEVYASFQRSLQELRSRAVQANPDIPRLQGEFLELQHYFQLNIASAELPDSEDINLSKLMSYQTEISKELRLLGTDIMFLQSARQPLKVQQRQAQLRDRLDRLTGYCDRILELS